MFPTVTGRLGAPRPPAPRWTPALCPGALFTLALALGLVSARPAQAQPPAAAARPAVADPGQPVPPVSYQSVFDATPATTEDTAQPWAQANQAVGAPMATASAPARPATAHQHPGTPAQAGGHRHHTPPPGHGGHPAGHGHHGSHAGHHMPHGHAAPPAAGAPAHPAATPPAPSGPKRNAP